MTLTNEQKAIIDNERTIKYVRLEFPNTQIDDIEYDKIYQESMSLEESLFDGDNLTFGKCNASLFKVKVADFLDDINNLDMNVYITFTHEDLGSVAVPFGKYIVQTVERTSDRRWRDITAVDYMSKFDVDIVDWYYDTLYVNPKAKPTVKQIREALCDYIDVDYEDVSLSNDDLEIAMVSDIDSMTARSFLEMILEISGAFGHFDWDGTLRFINLSKRDNPESVTSYKQGSCEYEDYDVEPYNSVVVQNREGKTSYSVYPFPEERENRYVISNNILLYNFNYNQLAYIVMRFYNSVYDLAYRNNSVEMFSHVYYPLGQYYQVTANTYIGSEVIENTFDSFILKRTITGIQAIFSAISASGERYSSNVRDITSEVATLRNRTEVMSREIEALANKVSVYLLYDNDSAYQITTNEEIIEIKFKTDRRCYLSFHASVVLELNVDDSLADNIFFDGSATFQFTINGLTIPDYIPIIEGQDGHYTIHLNYAWYNEILDNTYEQSIVVTCTANNALIKIPTYKIHGYLTGDGLYIPAEWDGRIDASTTFEELFGITSLEITDSVNIATQVPTPAIASDNVSFFKVGFLPLTDSAQAEDLMIFTTIVNMSQLTKTATISNGKFINGDVITPNIQDFTQVTTISTGCAFYASFDNGTTWKAYSSTDGWVEGSSMNAQELEAVPSSAWATAMIKVTIPNDASLTEIIFKGGHI